MEPQVRYATTTDGVDIAYWTVGQGTPLVHLINFPWSHLELEWRDPQRRRWYERLAEKRTLIRYDPRGAGLSDRRATEFSLDALVLDLEAVVDRLGLERLDLLGSAPSGPVAVAYAARHPDRVSHLILWCTSANPAATLNQPLARSVLSLIETDWQAFTETSAHIGLGWSDDESARRYAAFMRECVTPEVAAAAYRAIATFDATGLLPLVQSPTLVLHRAQFVWFPVDSARELAARIPNARLVMLEGESAALQVGDWESVFAAIDEFLSEGEEVAAGAEPTTVGTVHTILFTDVEGSTALTQRLGDTRARELLREHERMVREALKAHGGSEVKTMGDGFMASFSSATKALECAIAMQRAFAEHNESAEEPIMVRIGLNAGEPIAEDDDLFGTAVNLAARIAAKAEGGEILTSDTVRGLVAGKKFLFADRGETAMRGFEDSVRLYEVRWRES